MIRKHESTAERFLKRFKFFLLLFFFLAVITFSWWTQAIGPVDSADKSTEIFVIPPGQETVEITKRLKKEGLIKNIFAFELLLLKEGLWGEIQAGDFRLSPSMTARELALTLIEGRLDVWVVLPEGLRSEEVLQKAGEALGRVEEFQEGLAFFQKEEGRLFPDTYLVPREAGSEDVIAMLRQNFNRKTLSWQSQVVKSDLSQEEALILASLVEREAKFDEDRVKVAEILLKRLENNWLLQVDAAVQYIRGDENDWWPEVQKQDLKLDSEYNTYLYKGLPPGPICNPGLKSLEAVMQAEETPYWFYLSDKKGHMHYAVTLEDHEENVRKYLQD